MNTFDPTSELRPVFQSIENLSKSSSKLEKPSKSLVLIIAFYGVSSMGKTELVNFLREKASQDAVHVLDISKDSIARPLMNSYHSKNPDTPFEDIYMNIYPQVESAFYSAAKFSLESVRPGKNIILLDDAWANSKLVNELLSQKTPHPTEKKVICVYPRIEQQNLYKDLPFSLQFILNVCHRVVLRSDHETMVYNDSKKVQIVLSFIKLYAGSPDIPKKFLSEYSAVHEFSPIEFHQEPKSHLSSETTPQLIKKIYSQLEVCLEKLTVPFESPFVQGKEEVEELVRLLKEIGTGGEEEQADLGLFVNFGRKSEWEKWYSRISKVLI